MADMNPNEPDFEEDVNVDVAVGVLEGAEPASGPSVEPNSGRSTAPLPLRLLDKYSDLAMLVSAVICSVFVLLQMRPDLLISDTTPAGGDMGAHVWGPAFMRDHLLTSGRLTGWTPDWYAGFPAYHFYMLVPSLAIIALNTGFVLWLGIPLAVALLSTGWWLARRYRSHVAAIWSAGGLGALLLVGISYGASFKLVSVLGLVAMPMAAYAIGRLARSPEPVPAFLAFGTLVFLFDTNFSIYGGNIASTLAGEFAFSISLCLALLTIGLVMRGMDGTRDHVGAAVLIALVALCHIIPLIFLVVALVVMTVIDVDVPPWWVAGAGITIGLAPLSQADGNPTWMFGLSILTLLLVFGALAVSNKRVKQRMLWLLVVGPTAALLASFWLAPFYLRSDYFNDMGWERLHDVGPALLTNPMKIALPITVVGVLFSFVNRDRVGMLFSIMALTSASAVANLGDGKLWNARILPFYYLSVYVVAAIGIAHIARFTGSTISDRLESPDRRVLFGFTTAGLVASLVLVSMPLQVLPFGSVNDDDDYVWLALRTDDKSFIPDWVNWNYSGYEEKRSFREYHDVIATMDAVGGDVGCGRAMWEYSKDLDRYGTPMALMLLPHWTEGCIGSMEGLYFESSATTPFHFLNQSALSTAPSRAQRNLPYKAFSIDRGIAQLQVMGVRYYMAQSDEAILAARGHSDLIEVATSEPFVVFEVVGARLVEGLSVQPVVATGIKDADAGENASRFDVGWLSQAVSYYNDPERFTAMPAEDGPTDWQRVSALEAGDGTVIDPTSVTNISVGTDKISFEVDEIGKPVLVKMSYFPNWKVSGADGPWRVGPNLMVVVPTSSEVTLSYGQTGAEYLGYLLTLAGIAGLFLLRRHRFANDLSSSSEE